MGKLTPSVTTGETIVEQRRKSNDHATQDSKS